MLIKTKFRRELKGRFFMLVLAMASMNMLFAQSLQSDTLYNSSKPGGKGLPAGAFRNHIGLNEGKKWSENTLDQCKDIGIKLLRFDLEWNKIETQKGSYDWAEMDRYIDGCMSRGIKVLLILGKTNPVYDRTPTIPIPGNYLWEPYANYLRAAVERYGKKNVMWELWNEPDIPHMHADMTPVQFILNAMGAIEIIREIDPEATIIGPGSGFLLTDENESWNRQVLDNLKRQNKIGYFFKNLNAWTGHRYTSVAPDAIISGGKESYDLQREILDRFGGVGIPYATGERGFTANPKASQAYAFAGNEYLRISYYLRQCLWGMYKEPDGFIINYVTTDVYDSGKQILGNPAGEALKVMLDHIGDYVITERIKVYDEGVVLLKFTRGTDERYVVWDRKNRSLELNLPLALKDALGIDYQGNRKMLEPAAGYLTAVPVGAMPLIILPGS